MKWLNLKSNKCPKCGEYLHRDKDNGSMFCSDGGCGFLISELKYNTIINEQYRRKRVGSIDRDNMSDLNNLGHEEVREDFSDSDSLDY